MLLKTYLAAGALASGAMAGAIKKPQGVRCSAPEMTEEQMELNMEFANLEAEALRTGAFAARAQADIPVNVYLHTISADESTLLSVCPRSPSKAYSSKA